jgi:uncharacterized protein YjbJ (UPF0337 family)
MNRTEISGRYNVISGIMKQQWSRLTRNESRRTEGRFEEIMGRVQLRTGKTCRRLKVALGRSRPEEANTPPSRAHHPRAVSP